MLVKDHDLTCDEKSYSQSDLFKDKEKITSSIDQAVLDDAHITEVEQIFLETYGMTTKCVEHEFRIILLKLANKTPEEVDTMTTKQRKQEVLKVFTSISARISNVLGKNIYFPIECCLMEELNGTKDFLKEYHKDRNIVLGPEERKFYKSVLPMLKTQVKELPDDDHDSLAAATAHVLKKQPWILSRAKMFVKGHLFDVYTSSRTITEGDETSDLMKMHGCKIKYPIGKKSQR